MPPLHLGIIGLGNVGRGTLRILHDNASLIERKLGFPLVVKALCSRSVLAEPPEEVLHFPDALRTADWEDVVNHPDVHIVAELVGGTDVAARIVESSIAAGKSFVTANKELMAEQGADIWEKAIDANTCLAMEASVAGGIPIHSVLREGISGDRVASLVGILNGTSNYILTEMESRGEALETVLEEAQELGYAEADPTADVDGYDAQSKLTLLAALAFGVKITPSDIHREGIRRIRNIDFAYASRLGQTVRLIAAAEQTDRGLLLSVRPALIPRDTILAHVQGSYNAIWIRGVHGEDTFYYGRGAGPTPTGVAVVSDLMRVAREIVNGSPERVSPFAHPALEKYAPASIEHQVRAYYLRFRVRDQPGIIATLASILAEAGISLEAVLQEPSFNKADLPFVITIEPTEEGSLRQAVSRMDGLGFLVDHPLTLPLELGLQQ
ncbi:MAG: homoserine dehydrogenase [Bryobacterales bacterium]|nr:homoserine dehydrogenase [Bryobacterales bacterium]